MPINLAIAERALIVEALRLTRALGKAAELLGVTRHALKRKIIKHGIVWRPRANSMVTA